jgi:hypothetical protein
MFFGLNGFFTSLSLCIKEISELIGLLSKAVRPANGKKQIKETIKRRNRRSLLKSVDSMLENVAKLVNESKPVVNDMSVQLEKSVVEAFASHCEQGIEKEENTKENSRGEKTYIFPWHNPDSYSDLVCDRKKFKDLADKYLESCAHTTGHKRGCADHRRYRLCGFRSKPRRTFTAFGKREFPIRMAECLSCGQKFSLLPSFLPREKNYGIDIIGQVLSDTVRFAGSLQAALESLKLLNDPVKSKQTILNWLRWMGTLHPAAILTRTGVKGSGYFEEDEGFEKEPNLRTYTVMMVDPANMLVWHSDYVDAVDEGTLASSFKKFVSRIEFKVLGVAKDKWAASTNALKAVLKNVWIGFCHRHCLKKLYQDLLKYGRESGCDPKKISSLYKEIKTILDTSASQTALRVRLDMLKDKAFDHPILRKRIDSIREDSVYHTSSKRRKGISGTTSFVDNFLKIVKRKLRQAESFRDRQSTRFLFRAMANVRNFIPFLAGAKNAHKSPFILAEGQTFNLPWIQTMNVHNAFLFSDNAF